MRLIVLFILTVQLLVFSASAVSVESGESIQNAVDNAASGDTILVRNGVYNEQVVVDKTLNIIGESGTIIKGGFTLSSDRTTIDGFRITGADVGINVNSNENKIKNNIVVGNSIGIKLLGVNNRIFNNYFDNSQNAQDSGENQWNTEKSNGSNIIGGLYIAGNYWTNYYGIDEDGDGIGDTPYTVGSVNDPFPLVRSPVNTSTGESTQPPSHQTLNPAPSIDYNNVQGSMVVETRKPNTGVSSDSQKIEESGISSAGPSISISAEEKSLLEQLDAARISGDESTKQEIESELAALHGTTFIPDIETKTNGEASGINGGIVPEEVSSIQWDLNDILAAGTTMSEVKPDIVHDKNGNLYIAVEEIGSNTTRVYRSTNNGTTWNWLWWVCGGTYCTIDLYDPALAVGEGSNQNFLLMAVGGEDNWIRLVRLNLTSYAIDGGGLEYNPSGVANPAIVTDSTEYSGWYAYLVYNSRAVDNWVLRFTESFDYGATWSSPVNLVGYSGYPDNFYDGRNGHPSIDYGTYELIVAYDDYYPTTGTLRDIFELNSSNFGSSWNPRTQVTNSGYDNYNPKVAIVKHNYPNKTAVITYTRYYSASDTDAMFAYTTDNGQYWPWGNCLACSAENEENPDVVSSDTRGAFHTAYWHNYGIDYQSAAYDRPEDWRGIQHINSGSSASWGYSMPTITTNPIKSLKDEAAIAWTDFRNAGTGYDVYFDAPHLPGEGGCYNYATSQWITPPAIGTWNIDITDNIECNDTSIILNGDLQIRGKLRFNDVYLTMNTIDNGQYSIDTYAGSTFHIRDINWWGSVIDNGAVADAHYTFRVNAGTDFKLIRSTVRDAGYAWNLDTQGDNFNDAGLWIGANNVEIEGSWIYHNNFSGVILFNSNGNRIANSSIDSNAWNGITAINSNNNVFHNNWVESHGQHGFSVSGSNNTFTDNDVYNNYHGLIVSGTPNYFINNRVYDNVDIGMAVTSSNCNISNNYVSSQSRGIVLSDSSRCVIRNNEVLWNDWRGIDLERSSNNLLDSNRVNYTYISPDAAGIFLANSPDNNITRSIGYTNTVGIRLWNSPRTSINLSTQTIASAGISVEASDNSNISNNKAVDNGVGIQLSSTNNNKVMNNNVTNNQNYGISLYGSHSNGVTNNNATNTIDTGIGLSSSNQNNIANNTVEKANLGVSLRYSNYNSIVNNTLRRNNMGLYLSISGYNQMIRNYASDNNNEGVELSISDNNAVRDNNLSNNLNYGIHAYSSTGSDLKNNTLLSNGVGVFLDWSKNNNITQSRVKNSKITGIALLWMSDNNNISDNTLNTNGNISIKVSSSNNNKVINNTANDSDIGIFLDWSKNNNISRNNASRNNFHGISLEWFSDNNTIMNNNATDNIVGVSQMWSSNNSVKNNNLNRNNVSANLEWSSSNNILSNNNMNLNNYGITMMWGSTNNNISSNRIESNTRYGVYFVESSGNRIYNNYISNPLNAYDNGVNNWNITKTSGTNIIGGLWLGGNYWNDYAGVDIDSDGLGDTLLPYNSGGNISSGGDRRPLVPAGSAPQLIVSVLESPDPVGAGGTSLVTVHVTTTSSSPVEGASVSVSATGGSLIPASGTTDINGDFKPTYTAPGTPSTHTISATASKAGYVTGSGSDQITVSSSNTVSITDVISAQGSETRVPIIIYDSTGVASASVKLSYNASVVLAYSDPILDKGDFIDFYAPDNSHNTSGYITLTTYTMATSDNPVPLALTGNPVIGYVRLRAVGNGGDTSKLNLSEIVLTDDLSVDLIYAVRNGTFTIVSDPNPPTVTNPAANQSDIPDDTDNNPLWGETARLNVTVTDASGIASVTVNLSQIGGPAAKPMTNIGGNVYSTTTNASAGTLPKVYNLTVNATDTFGNSNISVKIELRVRKNGDTNGNNVTNIGDALRLANNVSYPGNPAYALSSIYVAEVSGNGVTNIGDALRLANNVSYPGNLAYLLK